MTKYLDFWAIIMNDTQKAALRSERDQLEGFQSDISPEDGVLFYLQYEDKEKKARTQGYTHDTVH